MRLKSKLLSMTLALIMIICTLPALAAGNADTGEPITSTATNEPRQMEYLNRGGFAATNPSGGMYLSWRLLGTEPMDTTFNIYKNGGRLVTELDNTNYTDATGTAGDEYTVAPVINGIEGAQSEPMMPLTGYMDSAWKTSPYAYFDIPLQIPPAGSSYTYSPNDASVGDVDGDGEYEIILKWNPSNSKDNASSGVTGNVYIDCYEYDGTFLWRIDLGRNIRAGAHYTQFQVYDYDGDGKAEVAMKTAPGSIDGKGKYVSDAGNTDAIKATDNSTSYVNSSGHIAGGPEFLTIFNGETGEAMQTIEYDPLQSTGSWGDSKYNRSERYLAGTAYLDGVHPSMVFCRGYYARSVAVAYDWDGVNLTKRWKLDSLDSGNSGFAAQGNHQLSVADLDNDGKDEIIYGAAAIDDDGSLMWSVYYKDVKLGHGDALHVSDFDNDGAQEIFKVNEDHPNWGRCLINADGTLEWMQVATGDDGRGVMANFSAKYGVLAWDSGTNVRTLGGTVVNNNVLFDNGQSYPNFPIYWDGDFYREHYDKCRIQKWYDYEEADTDGNLGSFGRILGFSGVTYNNDSKQNSCLQADLFGDWREELIFRTSDDSALRVYTSLIPTEHKLTTFMHDSQYRCAIAWQNTGYNSPPHTSYYIGEDKTAYEQPNIETVTLKPEIRLTVTADGNPVSGIYVKLGDTEKPTDSDGVVSFRVNPGTYAYTVDQAGYKIASGTVVHADGVDPTEQTIVLETLPDSTITVVSDGSPVSGATVVIEGQTAVTDENGNVTLKLRSGQNSYTVSCHKYITKTGTLSVPEAGTVESIEIEPVQYEYDSTKDADGSKFTYSGGDGAALSFSGGTWTFSQNSTDGGRSFGATFDTSADGNMEFEMTYGTGGQKGSNGDWSWTGRAYTHEIKLLDINGNILIGLSQEYLESGAQQVQYYTGSKSKTNVSTGNMIGAPNITARSASTWAIKFSVDFKAKTVDLTLTDEAGANGYEITDIPINVTNFSRVTIGSTASGNVTWAPTLKDVLYYSDCINNSIGTATPAPTEQPLVSKTWSFNDQEAGKTFDAGSTVANENGDKITVNYGTSAVTGAVPPTITERTTGDMYLKYDDKGSGSDGWVFEPETALDSEKVVFETDFMLGDTLKDTILLRIYDAANAIADNTYGSSDCRAFEIKTGDSGGLKLTDYFSMGASETKGLDTAVPSFTFEANKWYSVRLEYTKDDNAVKIYTKPDGGKYTLRLTYTLGSGSTSKVTSMPALAPTKVTCATRGSAANVLGVDNITVGVVMADVPTYSYPYTINSVLPSVDGVNVNLTNKSDTGAEPAKVIVAAYDSASGMLKNIGIEDASIPTGESGDVYVPITYSDSDLVIAYVWNSMSDIVPLATSYKLSN